MNHTAEQIEEKRLAIQYATLSFVLHYMEGLFENEQNEDLMWHMIENMNSLVVEYKRSKNEQNAEAA